MIALTYLRFSAEPTTSTLIRGPSSSFNREAMSCRAVRRAWRRPSRTWYSARRSLISCGSLFERSLSSASRAACCPAFSRSSSTRRAAKLAPRERSSKARRRGRSRSSRLTWSFSVASRCSPVRARAPSSASSACRSTNVSRCKASLMPSRPGSWSGPVRTSVLRDGAALLSAVRRCRYSTIASSARESRSARTAALAAALCSSSNTLRSCAPDWPSSCKRVSSATACSSNAGAAASSSDCARICEVSETNASISDVCDRS